MAKPRLFLQRLFGQSAPTGDPVAEALRYFRDTDANTLELARRLVAALRPQGRGDLGVIGRHQAMLDQLAADPALLAAFRRHIVHFVATRRLVTFFTESGVLPGTGFFSEWWRILGSNLLPEVADERRLKDCLHVIYDRTSDWRWLETIPAKASQHFWALIAPAEELRNIDWRAIQEQMLDAVLLLAHRVSGLGIESELMRASPN
jgi:site-specific recombinase